MAVSASSLKPRKLRLNSWLKRTRNPAGEKQHVAPAIAERWDAKGNGVEPVEQVRPEVACCNLVLERHVGGGYHSHIHSDRNPATHALDDLLLQKAQQLHLK